MKKTKDLNKNKNDLNKNKKKFRTTGLPAKPKYEYRTAKLGFFSRFFPKIKFSISLSKKNQKIDLLHTSCPEAY